MLRDVKANLVDLLLYIVQTLFPPLCDRYFVSVTGLWSSHTDDGTRLFRPISLLRPYEQQCGVTYADAVFGRSVRFLSISLSSCLYHLSILREGIEAEALGRFLAEDLDSMKRKDSSEHSLSPITSSEAECATARTDDS